MLPTGQPSFRWLERGDGEPLVLLHGLLGDMDHWEAVLPWLEHHRRPLALQLPLLDPAWPAPSVPGLARYAAGFMEALDLGPAVVGGNSLGGHVALELALSHPDRVSALVLAGSSGLFERSFTRGVPHRPGPAYVREKMAEVFFDPSLVTPERVERVRRIVTTRDLARRVLHVARAARLHNVAARLPEIRVPTLLVWGREDRVTPREVAERFHALIPGSDLVWLADCGHAPMLEHPERFAAVLRDWLAGTRPRRARLLPMGGVR
jgi:pimeloyl-ACP methyl ester carboxylesterase